jgi:hypothetical protein
MRCQPVQVARNPIRVATMLGSSAAKRSRWNIGPVLALLLLLGALVEPAKALAQIREIINADALQRSSESSWPSAQVPEEYGGFLLKVVAFRDGSREGRWYGGSRSFVRC